jgi:hypothetical protein
MRCKHLNGIFRREHRGDTSWGVRDGSLDAHGSTSEDDSTGKHAFDCDDCGKTLVCYDTQKRLPEWFRRYKGMIY